MERGRDMALMMFAVCLTTNWRQQRKSYGSSRKPCLFSYDTRPFRATRHHNSVET